MANIERRTTKDGKVKYRVKVRLKGAKPETATFDRLTDARMWAQQTEAAIREGRHFPKSIAKRRTLADLIDRYIRDILPQKKDVINPKRQLDWWRKNLGMMRLADLTPALLAEYRDKISAEGRSNATVVHYMSALSHVFTIAVKEYGWMESNPMLKVTKPKEPPGRVRFLSKDERERLFAACRENKNPDLYFAVVLALSTGARKSELMNLRWSQIDLQREIITLHETKNNERRCLALTGPALELMIERSKFRRFDTDLLFPGRDPQKPVDLRSAWEAALERAEINDFRWHDLRHTFASYLAMSGATLPDIAAAMGHKTLQMVQRYAHIAESHVQTVVSRMTEKHIRSA